MIKLWLSYKYENEHVLEILFNSLMEKLLKCGNQFKKLILEKYRICLHVYRQELFCIATSYYNLHSCNIAPIQSEPQNAFQTKI